VIIFESLVTGLIAAVLALLVNRCLLGLWYSKVISVLGPAVEEAIKTGLALLTGVSLAGVHSVFGLAEGVWELLNKPGSLKPALAAWGVHSLLGLLVYATYTYTGQAIFAWAIGSLVHITWNKLVIIIHH